MLQAAEMLNTLIKAACAIVALLIACVVRQHVQRVEAQDEATATASQRISSMGTKRPVLQRQSATVSVMRTRKHHHRDRAAVVDTNDNDHEADEPQQLWTLQVVFLLLSVLPFLVFYSCYLRYGYHAFDRITLVLFPVSLLGIFLQTVLNVELTPTPTKFERVHFWLWWGG